MKAVFIITIALCITSLLKGSGTAGRPAYPVKRALHAGRQRKR